MSMLTPTRISTLVIRHTAALIREVLVHEIFDGALDPVTRTALASMLASDVTDLDWYLVARAELPIAEA